MIRRNWVRFLKFKEFLGPEVKKLILWAALTGVMVFLVESSFVYILQGFLSSLDLVKESQLKLPRWYPRGAVISLLLLVAFGLFRSICLLTKDYLSSAVSESFIRYQHEEILKYVLFNAHVVTTHEVVQVFNVYSKTAGALIQQFSQFLMTAISATLLLALGFKLAPKELVLGIAVLSLLSFPFRKLGSAIRDYGERLNIESTKVSQTLITGIRNHFLLRLYNLVGNEFSSGRAALVAFERFVKRYLLLVAFKRSYPLFAGTLVISIMTYLGVRVFHTPGILLLSFFYIFTRFVQSASETAGTLAMARFSEDHFKRLYQWHLAAVERERVDAERRPAVGNSCNQLAVKDGVSIEARNITFGYRTDEPLLKGLSFRAGRGDVLVIRGPSGSGKSTLLTLVTGLNALDSGQILVNGKELADLNQVLSKHIAYVGPEPYLIQGSVWQNLVYGHPQAESVTEDELWTALEKAKVSELIRKLPQQLNEPVHELARLSTGQKQRLSIARALLRSPSILILDEATANLDREIEDAIIDSLKPLLKDLTTFIISHKDSFNRIATQEVCMDTEPAEQGHPRRDFEIGARS